MATPVPTRLDRLIEAARQLFSEKGVSAATVPEIAERAGVSTGLLYRYFPSKTALSVAIVEAERHVVASHIELLLQSGGRPEDALAAFIQGWTEALASDRKRCALMCEIGAQACRDTEIARVVATSDDYIVDRLVDLLGKVRPDLRAEASAVVLLSALDGLAARVALDEEFDPGPAAEALLTLFTPRVAA